MTQYEITEKVGSRPKKWPESRALQAGLILILVDAAVGLMKSGDLERAALCIAEAERCLIYLRSREVNVHIE